MILGDFNSPDIDWLTFSSATAKSELLCDFTLDNNLVQLIQEPTHVHGNILDLIFSNYNTTEFSNITVHPISDFRLQSDHNIITFVLAASPHSHQKKQPPKCVFNYCKADWENLFFWQALFNPTSVFHDVESCWTYLKNLIAEGVELYVPRMQTRINQHPCWFTPTLKHKFTLSEKKRRPNLLLIISRGFLKLNSFFRKK